MNIIATRRHDVASYTRLSVNAVARGVTEDDLLAASARFLRHDRVDAVILFVWSAAELVGQAPFDVARVQIARGKKRWTSDGEWLAGTPADIPERSNRPPCVHRDRVAPDPPAQGVKRHGDKPADTQYHGRHDSGYL